MENTETVQRESLAWSEATEDEVTQTRSWFTTIVLSVAVPAVVGISLWAWTTQLSSHESHSEATTVVPSLSVAPDSPGPQAISNVPDVRQLNVDDRFDALVRAHGITSPSEGYAVSGAHTLCDLAAQGRSRDEMSVGMQAANPTLTPGQATYLVNLALDTYCPEH